MLFKYAVLCCFIFNGIIFAQNYSKAGVSIKAKIVAGPICSINTSDLTFDESIRSAEGEYNIEPKNGAVFEVRNSKQSVMICYNNQEVITASVDDNKLIDDDMIFKPQFFRQSMLDNNTFCSNDIRDENIVKIWIGGTVYFRNSLNSQPNSKTFVISVIY